jgi:methionyl aminopeptidase
MKVNTQADEKNILILKDKNWLEKQRIAGKVVADTLTLLEGMVGEKTKLTTLELSRVAEDFIIKNNCTPTFKGYKGFPEAVCCSVNKQLVHGIPNNYQLQEGDIISFDLGATYNNVIADSATTCIYGDAKSDEHVRLINNTKKALYTAINKIKVGLQLGVIGDAIYKIGKDNGYGVVTSYGGHSICTNEKGEGVPHAFPFVSNKDIPNNGIRFQPGMTLAIEPLFVLGGDSFTYLNEDGWTVNCKNISCHQEHTIFVHENEVEILTLRKNENRI